MTLMAWGKSLTKFRRIACRHLQDIAVFLLKLYAVEYDSTTIVCTLETPTQVPRKDV
jgi:hypothetical protein